MRIVAIIEARMASSRLPGKVLLEVNGKPILGHLIARLRTVPSIDEIVLATTTNSSDDQLVSFAINSGIKHFRGSEEDVLERVIGAAEFVKAEIIVEITGDCPIIDPEIVEQAIQFYLKNDADYVGNAHVRTYPDGMDVQVFSLDVLKLSASMTSERLDREHVSLHIRNHPEIFRTINLIAPSNLFWPELGLTLDTKEDYFLIKNIIEIFSSKTSDFTCLDVINLLKNRPDLVDINKKIVRKGYS
jgi:spore coat polysaccharide biosynthesis protein SpsF